MSRARKRFPFRASRVVSLFKVFYENTCDMENITDKVFAYKINVLIG